MFNRNCKIATQCNPQPSLTIWMFHGSTCFGSFSSCRPYTSRLHSNKRTIYFHLANPLFPRTKLKPRRAKPGRPSKEPDLCGVDGIMCGGLVLYTVIVNDAEKSTGKEVHINVNKISTNWIKQKRMGITNPFQKGYLSDLMMEQLYFTVDDHSVGKYRNIMQINRKKPVLALWVRNQKNTAKLYDTANYFLPARK
ncbi:hypothetical protein HUJ05_008293 [Dendroctonus ponderosae]|nr:hypothetical protein HUJ05_008293 [Dendroctonus ponderosae]